MDKPNETEQRLIEIEIKATFTEELLDQLDKVVVRQQQQIDLLIGELAQFRQQSRDEGVGGPRPPHEDLPPHY